MREDTADSCPTAETKVGLTLRLFFLSALYGHGKLIHHRFTIRWESSSTSADRLGNRNDDLSNKAEKVPPTSVQLFPCFCYLMFVGWIDQTIDFGISFLFLLFWLDHTMLPRWRLTRNFILPLLMNRFGAVSPWLNCLWTGFSRHAEPEDLIRVSPLIDVSMILFSFQFFK